ncbi:TetR family transcriptional regulator [Saccharomonospora sp. NPDC006951]
MAFTERSEPTRTAILSAARKLLTEQGYDGTTIRAVAADVGIDPSMVMRYYGSKAGLFSAAVDLKLHLDEVPKVPANKLGEPLARHFLTRWEGDLSDEAIILLLRSAATNAVAAEHMRTIFDTQVARFVRRRIGTGAEGTRRAGLVSSQLLGLALTRYVVPLSPVVKMNLDAVVSSVSPVLQYYLTGNLGSAVKPRRKAATGG